MFSLSLGMHSSAQVLCSSLVSLALELAVEDLTLGFPFLCVCVCVCVPDCFPMLTSIQRVRN